MFANESIYALWDMICLRTPWRNAAHRDLMNFLLSKKVASFQVTAFNLYHTNPNPNPKLFRYRNKLETASKPKLATIASLTFLPFPLKTVADLNAGY